MSKLSEILEQLDIFATTIVAIENIAKINSDDHEYYTQGEIQKTIDYNLAVFDIQKDKFEAKFTLHAGYNKTIDNLIFEYLIESPESARNLVLEKLESYYEYFTCYTKEDIDYFITILRNSAETIEKFKSEQNFAKFIILKANTLRQEIPNIINKFMVKDKEDSTPSTPKQRYNYDVDFINDIYSVCSLDVFDEIEHIEFCECVANANFMPIFETISRNKNKGKLLYIIHRIKDKVNDKDWYSTAAQSIGYQTVDCTKGKRELPERWRMKVDKIK